MGGHVTGTLVDAVGLSVHHGTTSVVGRADVLLAAGDEVALVGRSGSGKSTLLLALAGLLPVGGTLNWPALSADPARRRAQIGMIFQAPSLVPELTAWENVALPLRLNGAHRAPAAESARQRLDELGLGDAADAVPAELSGGSSNAWP